MLRQCLRILRYFLPALPIVGLFGVSVYTYADVFYEPTDSIVIHNIADSLNAYDIYDEAGSYMSPKWFELEKLSSGAMWRQSLVDSVVTQSDGFIKMINMANKRKYCYKQVNPDYRADIPRYFNQLRLARTYVVRMKNCIFHDDHEKYLQELECCLAFVNKFDKGSTNLVQYTVTMNMYKLIYNSILDAIKDKQMNETYRAKTIKLLDNYKEDNGSYIRGMRFEEVSGFNLLDAIDSTMRASGGNIVLNNDGEGNIVVGSILVGHWRLMPNRTKRISSKYFNTIIRNVEKYPSYWETPDLKKAKIKNINNYANSISSFLNPNWVGEYIATIDSSTFRKHYLLYSLLCEINFVRSCIRIADAMDKFHQSTALNISSLEELVPNYLDSVPLDPFCGEKLKYNANLKVLYSLGPDLTDSLGSDAITNDETFKKAPGRLNKQDLVFHVE